MFPNFFFDRYEFFVNKKIKERDLLEFINQIEIYEININKLYKIINNWYKIPEIKWIEKSIEY